MKNESAHDRESLGQFLRRTRKEQGLSFEEAVESTKISPNNLRALEEDDYANLPADAFVNGFYGIYARYLSLDPEEIRNRYNQQKKLLPKKANKRSPTPGQLAIQTSSMAEPPSVASHSVIGLSFLALIVLGIAICWYFSWNPATYLSQKLRGVTEQPLATDEQPVPATSARETPVSDSSQQAPAVALPPAAPAPAQPSPATEGTAVQEELAPNNPATAGQVATASPAPVTAAAPGASAYILKASFKEPTKLTIKIDDKPAEHLSFTAGAVQSWSAGKSIVISLPAGTGASLTLNDLPLTLPKKSTGEEMTISIPEYLLE
jgi:cytoskeletal protein RodZ